MKKKCNTHQEDIKKLPVALTSAVNFGKHSQKQVIKKISKRVKHLNRVKRGDFTICKKCGKSILWERSKSLCPSCYKKEQDKRNKKYKDSNEYEERKKTMVKNRTDNLIYIAYDFLTRQIMCIGETTDYGSRHAKYKNKHEDDTTPAIIWLRENNREIEEFFIFKFELHNVTSRLSNNKEEIKKYRKILEYYLDRHLSDIVHIKREPSGYNEEIAKYMLEQLLVNNSYYEIHYYTSFSKSKEEKIEDSILYYFYHNELENFKLDEKYMDEPLYCKLGKKN